MSRSLLAIGIIVLLNNILTIDAIVGGHPAKPPPPDDPVVFITKHGKTARILGTRDEKYYAFRGMRYAQAPTGRNRFMRPVTHHLQGDLTAANYGPPCVQQRRERNGYISVIGSEDCLFINVFSVQLPDGGEGAPVVVWIHGGGFGQGSGSQYDPKKLTEQRLVVVTFNYRLGSFGYLSSRDNDLSGNAGLFDMALALRWVRDYIAFFGGNPKNVITMGHETGASSAALLSSSRMSRSYQHGVVAMSGSPLSHWTIDKDAQKPNADKLAAVLGCDQSNTVEKVRCLQEKPFEEIAKLDSNLTLKSEDVPYEIAGLKNPGPVIEQEYDYRGLPSFIQQEPLKSLQSGQFARVPLLIGVTANETAGAINGQLKANFINKLKSIPDFIENEFANQLKSVANTFKAGFLTNVVTDFIEDNFLSVVKPSKSLGKSGKTGKKSPVSSVGGFLKPVGGVVNNTVKNVAGLSGIFKNYLKVPSFANGNFGGALAKIAEVTGDVFFNVPAFLTASMWAKTGTPTYMYQFNHKGKRPRGSSFFERAALTSADDDGSIAHGDDLSYLFDPLSVEGEPLNILQRGEITYEDQQVRDHFMGMITEFAGMGQKYQKPRIKTKRLSPFTEKDSNFLKIGLDPKVDKNFRYCEIAVWGELEDRLKSPLCQFLGALDSAVGALTGNLPTGKLTNLPGKGLTGRLIGRGPSGNSVMRSKSSGPEQDNEFEVTNLKNIQFLD